LLAGDDAAVTIYHLKGDCNLVSGGGATRQFPISAQLEWKNLAKKEYEK
jgi:hypothetical protein